MGSLCMDAPASKQEEQELPQRPRQVVYRGIQNNEKIGSKEELKESGGIKSTGYVDRSDQTIKKLQQVIKRQESMLKMEALEKMKIQQQLNRMKGSMIRVNNTAQEKALAQMQLQLEKQRRKLREKDEQNKRLFNQVKQREMFVEEKQRSIESTVNSLCGQKISQVKKIEESKSAAIKRKLEQEKQREVQKVRSQLTSLNAIYTQKERNLSEQITRAKSKVSSYQQVITKMQVQLQKQRQAIKLRDEKIQEMRYNQLFQNDIFQNKQYYKKYLATCLENRYNSRVVQTRLLYRHDLNNKVNFHKYIDQTPNIIVIIRLSNGFYAAAYSQSPFVPRTTSSGDALLISLTNQRVFYLLELNRRGITYDDYYIIFGNSELRLRSQENRVFSNFGISNGYFANRGETVNIILGEGTERQVDLAYFQAYQVIFESI